jgi:hypothetical protein
MLPIASDLVVRTTRAHAQSALPDAPVLPDVPVEPTPRERRRIQLAGFLRRVADRLEPARPTNHRLGSSTT